MEKIYHELDEKSGCYDTDSPCMAVRAFRPNIKVEEGLPAIIVLESGKINSTGYPIYNYSKYISEHWNHKGSELIRKAIKEFDAFKEEVYKADASG